MLTRTFPTVSDAIASGYRRHTRADIDISGPNSFGYAYRDAEGNETVTVSLTEAKNKIGGVGAFLAMFPPRGE